MIISEAIDQIQELMGLRSDLAARASVRMSQAQTYYERGPTFPWFLLSEISQTTAIPDTRRILVPEDYLAEYEEGALWIVPADSVEEPDDIPLIKKDMDYLDYHVGSSVTGRPRFYSQDGNYFRLYPQPDQNYTIKMLYYKTDLKISELSNDQTCLWLTHAPECIIGRAGRLLATAFRDPVAKSEFEDMEGKGRLLLTNQNEAKKHVNRSYQIGGPH